MSLLPLLLACAGPPTLEPLLAADPARGGEEGADGPWGVARFERRWSARVTDHVDCTVLVPVDAAGVPAAEAPTVVFVQGGLVAPERYEWLGLHLASRGYAVLLPHHPLDLAIDEIGNASAAWTGAAGDPDVGPWVGEQAVVAGHSLGGVVAVKNWLALDSFAGVTLMASYPAAGDDPARREGSPALVFEGTTDGSASAEDVEAGFERFTDPSWLAVVEGMNHYAWTDHASAEDLAGDGVTEDVPGVRLRALAVWDPWLDMVLRDDSEAAARLREPFEGVEVTW